MSIRVVTPKFLTKEMAESATNFVLDSIFQNLPANKGMLRELLSPKRDQCHIVILVPGMQDDRRGYPHFPIEPVVLYEHSKQNGERFEHPFDLIARCKALQLWDNRNDDRTDCQPHLLFQNDTPYWGGVKRRGIVVACSGVQPWIDKLVSGMIADLLVAMAHAAWVQSGDQMSGVSFLT